MWDFVTELVWKGQPRIDQNHWTVPTFKEDTTNQKAFVLGLAV